MAEFPQSRTEAILQATINGEEYTGYPESRIEELLLELKEVIEEGGGGGAVDSVNGQTGIVVLDAEDVGALPDTTNIPSSTSDLTNDSGFITNAVNDLISYYLKSETYTKTEVNTLIGAISTIHFEAVLTLPTENIQTNVIYLVPKSISQSDNIKDEYINLDGTTAGWEKIGETEIDLSGYVTTTDLNTALASYVTSSSLASTLSDYIQKSSTTGLLKNDGTVDTNTYATTSSLSDYVAKSQTAGLLKNDGTVDTNTYATTSSLSDYVAKSQTAGLLKNDGTVDTNTYATTSSLSDYVTKSQTAGLLKNDGTVDTNTYALASALPGIATSQAVGLVKPDGTTVTIDANGALTAIASLPENPITTAHGGTGNTDGYIRTGAASGSTIGTGATIEGTDNEASGDYAHAEGSGTTASGDYSHAEGHGTTAYGGFSHAQGANTIANGLASSASGLGTIAGYADQTVVGAYNNNKSTTLFEVGNGSADNARSNALEVTSTGDVIAGRDVIDGNGNSLSSVGGKANKPSTSTDGNVAALDSNGNLVDSGKSVDEIGNVDFEIVDTDEAILKKGGYNAMTKSWNSCPTYLTGDQVWKDGDDIYFTNSGTWKLNKATNTWASYSWSGSNIPVYGYYIWTDGTNIYFNNGPDNQWKLNKSTNAWDRIYWNQNVNYGTQVWHGSDGNTYATLNNNTQYVLNGTQWNTKTWTGKVPQAANKIWNHKGETYYSNASYQWKLNKSTGQFENKSWSGLTSFHGDKVWSNGEVAGYTTPDGVNYILDDATSTWKTITWDNNINNIDGHKVWTDGKKIYYSDYAAKEYELFPTRKYEEFDISLKLSALSDTSLSSPSDGQILVFNGTTGKWENKDKEIYLEQSVTLSTSQTTTVTFSNAAFTATSVVDPAISVWGIFPEDVTVASGSCTVVMPKVSSAQTVTVGIFIKR